jgi:Glucodextranase, domain B
MTTRRGGRPSQVRPRPPSTGRPAPIKVRPRAPTPDRLSAHRRIERGPGIALPFQLLAGVAVIALGVGVLLIANGGLGKVATVVGTTFNGLLADLTKTPAPSTPDLVVADAPTLEAPDEPYTNQPTVDLTGTVPAAIVGQTDSRIRIYLTLGDGNRGVAIEVPVGTSQHFLVPGLTLSKGTNTFTATIIGPTDLESESSAAVSYILDTAKPKITISSPKADAVVNAKSVQVVGQTQARSALSLRNLSTNATVAGVADAKGAFSIAVPIGTGTNKVQVTATDPAGNVNVTSVTVRRGSGKLTANVTASFYQLKVSRLPESVRLQVMVTDPDGRALAGASVTFTLAVPGVPAIASSTLKTGSNGRTSFTTTIPKGATVGQCSVAVFVRTTDLGDTLDRTVITIQK